MYNTNTENNKSVTVSDRSTGYPVDFNANNENVIISAPDWVEKELNSLIGELQGTEIKFPNKTTKTITDKISLIDLYYLTRNEGTNINGMIASYQYKNISQEVILTLKDLVRQCVIVGLTRTENYGGYKSTPVKQDEDVYLIDSIGLQFQMSENTGRLLLISKKSSPEFSQRDKGFLDDVIYKAVVGEAKKTHSECLADNTGRYVKINIFDEYQYFDTVAYQRFIAQDVVLAGMAQDAAARRDGKETNFKFLQQGAGFFAGGAQDVACKNIAEGIRQGIEILLRNRSLKNTRQIELPYFPEDPVARKAILELCEEAKIECVFSSEDALKQTSKFVTATTNCADPHAAPGNEMRYTSVDAAIGKNLVGKGKEFSPLHNESMGSEYVTVPRFVECLYLEPAFEQEIYQAVKLKFGENSRQYKRIIDLLEKEDPSAITSAFIYIDFCNKASVSFDHRGYFVRWAGKTPKEIEQEIRECMKPLNVIEAAEPVENRSLFCCPFFWNNKKKSKQQPNIKISNVL